MSDMKIIVEESISSVELLEQLKAIKKKNKELNAKGEKTMEFLNAIEVPTKKEAEELKKKIIELNIPRLKERHINKVIEVMPTDMDSLKMLFSGENLTIKQEDLNKILSLLKKH